MLVTCLRFNFVRGEEAWRETASLCAAVMAKKEAAKRNWERVLIPQAEAVNNIHGPPTIPGLCPPREAAGIGQSEASPMDAA